MNTESKNFKHHLMRKNQRTGTKLIKKFEFNDFVAAKIMCDELNQNAAEVNPYNKFVVITMEVK